MKSYNSKNVFTRRRLAWKRWCFALCMTVALLASSCRSTRQNIATRRLDSLVWDRKASVTPEIIPPSRATLAVPVDSLRRLPAGAAYTEKSGQATVSLSYEDGNVVASAVATASNGWCSNSQNSCTARQNRPDNARNRKPLLSPPSANGSKVLEQYFNRNYINDNHSNHL